MSGQARMLRRLAPGVVGVVIVLAGQAGAGTINVVDWIGPNLGTWHIAGNWDPATIPNNAVDLYHARVINGGGIQANVNLNTVLSLLTIAPDNVVHIDNGRILRIDNTGRSTGVIDNQGLLRIGSVAGNTYLRVSGGPLSFTGGGEIAMTNSASNWIYRDDTIGSFINVDNTIRGSGHIGWTASPPDFENAALIQADQANALNIDVATLTNTGTMRATNGATLSLNTGTFDNTGGVIEALEGSFVNLNGSIELFGGELTTAGSGEVRASTSTPQVTDVTNSGFLRIVNGRIMVIEGSIENTGSIRIDSGASNTYLRLVSGPVTLTGGGVIELSNSASNWIFRNDVTGALVNVDNTIRGSGHLGWSASPTDFDNQALIVANQANVLNVDVATLTNTGTLRAESGATMSLNTGVYDNTNGVIEALDGSFVNLNGSVDLFGGELTTVGTGEIRVSTSTPLVTDVTNSGYLRLNNGRILQVSGSIHNTGTIRIDSTGSNTYLRPVGGVVTLTGGGVVELTNASAWIFRDEAGSSLVNEDNTIRGAGNLGWSAAATAIINRGTIEADSTVALLINAQPFINEGLLHVIGAGGVGGSFGAFTNSGQIVIDATRKLSRATGITQDDGSIDVVGELELSGTNVLEIAGGVLKGTGLVDADVLNSGGSVEPGASIESLAIEGKYTQITGGRLTMELGGAGVASVDYDLLTVTGQAVLGGQLRLVEVNGYVPQIGDTFTVLTAGSVTGRFDSIAPCGTYLVSYTPTSVVIEVQGGPPLVGDLSCDGDADLQDLGLFCGQLGLTDVDPGFNPQADLNDDGVIDYDDRASIEAIVSTCGGDTVSSASFQPPPDGTVDAADLAFLLGRWGVGLSCADSVASATFAPPPDGTVDAADLAFLLGNWGPCD